MSKLPCSVCGREFSDAVLLYGDDGRICAECQAEADEQAEASSRIWSLAAGPIVLSFAATAGALGGCVPLVGILFLLLAPLFALVGAVAAGRAIHAGVTRPEGVEDQHAGLLIGVGAICLPWAAAAGLWSVVFLLMQVFAMVAGGSF